MKKLYIILFVSILLIAGGQKVKYKDIPPGTVFVKDSLYIDIQPVRVRDYLEFLTAIKQYYSLEFRDSLEKLPLWGQNMEQFKKMKAYFPRDSIFYQAMIPRTLMTHANDRRTYDMDYHLTNPIYRDFPVVNITYEQAKEFCRWRTTMVKFGYAVNCKNEKQRRKYPMNFVYRLPNRTEWQFTLGEFFDEIKTSKLKKDPRKPPNIVAQYDLSKKRKFYYETENVAELLDNAIITSDFMWVGGIGNISFMNYDTPKDWLGFRCVCQILEEKAVSNNQPTVLHKQNNSQN